MDTTQWILVYSIDKALSNTWSKILSNDKNESEKTCVLDWANQIEIQMKPIGSWSNVCQAKIHDTNSKATK